VGLWGVIVGCGLWGCGLRAVGLQRDIVCGVQVASFFSLRCVCTPTQGDSFVYLKPTTTVYSMVLLAPQHVDPDDNYTLSREGISHFCRTGCEFTALDRFEREFYLYQRILLVRCVLAVADEVCAWVGGRGGGW
jgi:hypothetical protein